VFSKHTLGNSEFAECKIQHFHFFYKLSSRKDLGKCFIELAVGRLFVTDISPEFIDFLKKSFENRIEEEKEENLES
jgi:hypothetical protein